MPRICNLNYKESGPLPQTLFLGCSISNATFNMAWGSEPSNCTVRLVKDTSAHPNSPDFGSTTVSINTILTSTAPSEFVNSADLNRNPDGYAVHKNIAKEEQKREEDRINSDISNTPLIRNRDSGKKCWDPHNLSAEPVDWLGPDPGFVGDNSFIQGHLYDSVGCPVYFRLDDLEFGGLLNNWKVDSAIYTVDVQGPGRILKGCQLILNEYQGSVSTVLPNATAFPDGSSLSMPYIKFKNIDGTIRPFNADIKHGNIPNLFNVYGYLIETRGFNNVDVSELGISAAQVYDALIELIAHGPQQILRNPFSPYGAIVAKSLLYFGANNATRIIDPMATTISYAGSTINLTQLGFFRHILAIDNIYRPLFRLDLSQVPRPPQGIYLDLTNNIALDEFINKCCDGAGLDWNCSLEPDLSSSQFSGRILIRTYERKIQPSTKIIRGLISTLTPSDRIVSYSVGETHTDDVNRKIAIGGKQKRLLQLQSNTISKYKHINIYDADTGRFNKVQDDLAERFLVSGNSRQKVRWPMPESTRAWDASFGPPYRTYGGAATAQDNNDFLASETTYFNTIVTKGNYDTQNPKLADPNLPDQPADPDLTFSVSLSNKSAYPVQLDLISQYFGRNSDGSLRSVYYDRRQRQYIANVFFSDLKPIFSINNFDINIGTPYRADAGVISIYETEIRAALGSFDSWVTYLFEMKKYGYETPTCALVLSYIARKYGPAIANQLTFYGVGSLKDGDTKKEALPTNPPTVDRISPGNRIIFQNDILPVLQKLHNFITSELGSRYGKSYLVRLPTIYRRVDSMGMAHYSYDVTDSAWEEVGNFIDDTIQIGSNEAFTLSENDGRIGPLLGWNASAERTHNHPMSTAANPSPGLLPISRLGTAVLQSDMPQIPNDWYLPLQHNMTPSESVLVRHTSYLIPPGGAFSDRVPGSLNAAQLNDSFGNSIPDNIKAKLYTKAQSLEVVPENRTNKNIIFANGIQYAVLDAPSPVTARSEQSLAISMFENLIAAGIYGIETPGGATRVLSRPRPYNLNNIIFTYGLLRKMIVHSAVVPDFSVSNDVNLTIAPLCPTPCFAAIPLQLNYACYGPWVSHPGLISNILFPNDYADHNVLANNIVGGVEVDINSSYVPWEYGGMDSLDEAILLNLVADSNKYQQVQEEGQITVANMLFRNGELGARLVNTYGPVINAINIDLGEDGIKCTYHFRTYNRKLGFFNKEQSNQIQKIGKERLSNRKIIADNITALQTRQIQQANNAQTATSLPKALSYSPVRLLIGGGIPLVHKDSNLQNAYSELNYNAQWFMRPDIQPFRTVNPKDMINHQTAVALYDPVEVPKNLLSPENYSSLSVMSLDGLFSPISFYPTAYGTTYPLSPYPRSHCPICGGAGRVTMGMHTSANSQFNRSNTSSFINVSAFNSSFTTTNVPCKFCVPDIDIEKTKKKSAQPNEITPPMLIASGSDRQILTERNLAFQFQTCKINTYTLNPIVMSATGSDFSIYQHKQRLDRCGHSVGAVSFGNIFPDVADGLAPILTPNIVKNYSDYDINLINHNSSYSNAYQNQRFFGLRGPIMIHSWGYDLEGYPVPNSSGEYKYSADSQIVNDSDGNAVGRNQVLQSDGTWSAPYKENTFYKGWAQLPSTWPVGPLDLRWDSNAKVWTIGANYKPVWIVIETDLLDRTNTARGIVVESSYDNTPLPDGLRKVVFVKDSLGIFSAPRGAALYCKYNTDNGFYEPIYNRPLMTSGQLLGGLNALIYNGYTPSIVSRDIVSQYVSTFLNPINFATPAGNLGLFVFLNGSWVLQSIKT